MSMIAKNPYHRPGQCKTADGGNSVTEYLGILMTTRRSPGDRSVDNGSGTP
jgi:hypothetical protein